MRGDTLKRQCVTPPASLYAHSELPNNLAIASSLFFIID